jgi:hypothetical protein
VRLHEVHNVTITIAFEEHGDDRFCTCLVPGCGTVVGNTDDNRQSHAEWHFRRI